MQPPLPSSPRLKDDSSSVSDDLLSNFESFAISASSSKETLLDIPVALTTLADLAQIRNGTDPSQERQYKVACDTYNTTAFDLTKRAFRLLSKSEATNRTEETISSDQKQAAYGLVQKVIQESNDPKLDKTLYALLSSYPQTETYIIQQLTSYLYHEIITHKERESLFREDCVNLKILRIIQSGYLKEVFKQVERYSRVDSISTLALAASPFKILNESLNDNSLPDNFFKLYRIVYNTLNEKYFKKNSGPARQGMLQLIFLRGVSPFYIELSQNLKNPTLARKCIEAAKLIQSVLSEGKAISGDSRTVYSIANEFSKKLVERIKETSEIEPVIKTNNSKKSLFGRIFA